MTPVDTNVARPLVEGLRTATVVTDPRRGAVRDRADGLRRGAALSALEEEAEGSRRGAAAPDAPGARAVHARPARARPPGARGRRRASTSRWCRAFVLDERCSPAAAARRTGSRSCSTACAISTRSLRERGARLVVRARRRRSQEAIALARELRRAGDLHERRRHPLRARARHERLARACARRAHRAAHAPGVGVVAPGALTPAGRRPLPRLHPLLARVASAPPRQRRRAAPRAHPDAATACRRERPCRAPRSATRALAASCRPAARAAGRRAARALAARRPRALRRRATTTSPPTRTSRLSALPALRLRLAARRVLERSDGRRAATRSRASSAGATSTTRCSPPPATCRARDYRPRGDRWRRDRDALEAWSEGLTGYPIVDAGMRQLAREGFMHNRARLIVALVPDEDAVRRLARRAPRTSRDCSPTPTSPTTSATGSGSPGTGNDTRPNRVLNPLRQAQRFDPDGDYVRRYVPELPALAGPSVHEPWRLPAPSAGAPLPAADRRSRHLRPGVGSRDERDDRDPRRDDQARTAAQARRGRRQRQRGARRCSPSSRRSSTASPRPGAAASSTPATPSSRPAASCGDGPA